MAGQMGNVQCTVQNLEIVRVDKDKNLLLVKGSVPGAPGGDVIVRPTVKNN
jgi:large subunit ribosomal protein L3